MAYSSSSQSWTIFTFFFGFWNELLRPVDQSSCFHWWQTNSSNQSRSRTTGQNSLEFFQRASPTPTKVQSKIRRCHFPRSLFSFKTIFSSIQNIFKHAMILTTRGASGMKHFVGPFSNNVDQSQGHYQPKIVSVSIIGRNSASDSHIGTDDDDDRVNNGNIE